MKKIKISENFSYNEFIVDRQIYDTCLSLEILNNLIDLVENVLQPLRTELNNEIIITSGVRSIKHNQRAGGALNSQHLTGQAADFVTKYPRYAFNFIRENLEFDQLIWEFGDDEMPAWIHVSFAENQNRKQVLRAVIANNTTTYSKMY